MILGIAIGVGFMICLVIAFIAGYGFADMKYKSSETEQEQ